jgi:Protein of unknown function (DUF1186)
MECGGAGRGKARILTCAPSQSPKTGRIGVSPVKPAILENFWQRRVRKMDWDQILQAFRMPQRGYPVDAARAILDDPLLYERTVEEFQRISTQSEELADSMFHLHAMHLLAEKRDSRAFRPLLAIAELPQDELDMALGDHLTETFRNCVAAVCDDETAIQRLIEDSRRAEWVRAVLVDALTQPVFAGERDAAPVLAWLLEAGERLLTRLTTQATTSDEEADSLVLTSIAGAVAEIGDPAQLETLKRWWDSGWLDPQTADWNWYAEEISSPWSHRLEEFNRYHRLYMPDAIAEMQNWYCFSDRFHDREDPPPPARRPDNHDSAPFVRKTPRGLNRSRGIGDS